jgi:hypothetical protein
MLPSLFALLCSGKDGSTSNWPGLEGRPPLVIDAPRFTVLFKSDTSNNDWGFKLSAEVQHHIITLLLYCAATLASYLTAFTVPKQGYSSVIAATATLSVTLTAYYVSLTSCVFVHTLNRLSCRHLHQ